MPYDAQLAERIRKLLAARKNFAEKKMFGGLGFLLNGNVCCGVWNEFLILPLGGEAARRVLSEERTRPFDITGKPMRGWAMSNRPGGAILRDGGAGPIGPSSLQSRYLRSKFDALR
jgi:hypothetical protein